MASHDLSVFLEEFGATVNLTLPGIVSEKERLLLKLLMEGMSVTEISQYRNRSAKTISHQKKQLYEKLGIQRYYLLAGYLFSISSASHQWHGK